MNLRLLVHSLIKDPIRKIFAIIFAFGLWFYVAIDNDYQYTKRVALYYINTPESLIVVDSISHIDVAFRGRGGSLLSLWALSPKALCDLRDSRSGQNTIPVKDVFLPTGFADVAIDYPRNRTLSIRLDKKITKAVDIKVPVKDALKEDYSLVGVSALDTIVITGPREILQNIRELTTESLSVKNRNASFKKTLKIIKPSSFVRFSKDRVTVSIAIEKTIEKIITNINLRLIYAPNQRVSTERKILDTLIIRGPASKVESLNKKDIDVYIRVVGLDAGEYYLPVSVATPAFLKPVYWRPQKYRIRIS